MVPIGRDKKDLEDLIEMAKEVILDAQVKVHFSWQIVNIYLFLPF